MVPHRHARKEKHHRLPVLSGAVRRRHVHNSNPAADALLLLQSDSSLRAHLLNGAAGLHAAAGLWREADTRSDHLALVDRVPEPRGRNLAPSI